MSKLKNKLIILISIFLLSGCLSESRIIIDDNLSEDMYFSTDRLAFQENIVVNENIITVHYPEYYVSSHNYHDVKTVLKKYDVINNTNEYVDNNPASLCNSGKIEDCSSYLTGQTQGLIRSENHLYFTTIISTDKMDYKEVFVRTNLDGSNMTVIYEIPFSEENFGSVEYVVLDEKVYYSFFESSLYVYNEATGSNEEILKADNDNFGFWDFMVYEHLTFRADSFKNSETGQIHKNAYITYYDGLFHLLEDNVDEFNTLILTTKFRIETDSENNNKLFVKYADHQKELLTDDFKYLIPGGYIVSKDYVILNYMVDSDSLKVRTVIYKIDNNKLIKLDENEEEEVIHLNTLYKNLLVYTYFYEHPDYGSIASPMYTTINKNGFSDFIYIDEYK